MAIKNAFPSEKGIEIDGLIQDYYAYAGENISVGDFVEFVEGVAEAGVSETQVKKVTSGQFNGISKSNIVGGTPTFHNGHGDIIVNQGGVI